MKSEPIRIEVFARPNLSDLQIDAFVRNAIKWQSTIPEDKIEITVKDGIVKLEGEADSEYQRNDATEIVKNLTGVRKVINSISVKPKLHKL